jgi:mRNA-degrading endonuclease RelE of RelBE toxin-antitoxin system
MRIGFKPRAVKDLDALDRQAGRRVLEKIRGLENNLAGDVKRFDQLHARISLARRRLSRAI